MSTIDEMPDDDARREYESEFADSKLRAIDMIQDATEFIVIVCNRKGMAESYGYEANALASMGTLLDYGVRIHARHMNLLMQKEGEENGE